ncbi:MAG TPA: hypothetical protein VFT59_02800 [Candidatus Saccharimonadales bacterium]|nr:hypothetical protein [Candidatus Saccharimonadales bacterium]
MTSTWAKRLAAIAWLFLCAYGVGYSLGRVVAPGAWPEYMLSGVLLIIGVCLAVSPLIVTITPSTPSNLPMRSPGSLLSNAVPSETVWEEFLREHNEVSELAVLPRVFERLYTS